jgi:hypothetical protein
MERYTRTVKGRRWDLYIFPNSPRLLAQNEGGKYKDFIDLQPWNGSVYSHRPRKHLPSTSGKGDRLPFYLAALSTMPIFIAAVSAFVLI